MVAAAAAAEADDDENDDGLSQESTVSTLVDEMSITNLSNDIQAVNWKSSGHTNKFNNNQIVTVIVKAVIVIDENRMCFADFWSKNNPNILQKKVRGETQKDDYTAKMWRYCDENLTMI